MEKIVPPKSKVVVKRTRTPKKKESDLSGGMKSGSTRVRLFKALVKVTYPDGLSVAELRVKCGLPPSSGHVLSLMVEEVAKGRFLKFTQARGASGVETNVYCLTPLGLKDYRDKTIDYTNYAGKRIGTPWTKARKRAEASA